MSPENHVIDLLPGYALDCLDDPELLLVAEHLAGCESCRRDLAAYQEAADLLPLALAQVDPPAALKSRLLAGLGPTGATKQPAAASPKASPRPRFSLTWALAASGAIAIILLIISNLLMWQQVRQVARVETPLIALQGIGPAGAAAGTIVVSRDGLHGALIVDRLEPLPEDQQYQLWLIKDGQRLSGAVFSVDEAGYGLKYIKSPDSLLSYDSFGVTVEPAGGSPGPTGQKVLGGDR